MQRSSDDAWMIESYVGGTGWSMSRLNDTDQTHTLEWCLDRWRKFRNPPRDESDYDDLKYTTEPHRYRLRNIITQDIIMCGIL